MPAVEAIRWSHGSLELLDQRLLPTEEHWLDISTAADAAAAIAGLVVRGAPAIGITAAYACVLAADEHPADGAAWNGALDALARARPTAVNLAWAVERMRRLVADGARPGDRREALEREARNIHDDDIQANRSMARLGAQRIAPGSRVLTHCNTGSLATGGVGTALGVIVEAFRQGRVEEVFACETRPWLQGLRLTAWEFGREDVPCRVLVEGAAAGLMAGGGIDWVITGADRICANGDVANKVGTLMLAALARRFGARMMVVAPVSTVDPVTADGSAIAIEHRDGSEIWGSLGLAEAPGGAAAWNPVFDITPADLIDCIVTERGVLEAPYRPAIERLYPDSPAA